jgi:predicted ArsR family transcriptional regulator
MTNERNSATDLEKQWSRDRTTFQRVYDVLVGTSDPVSAQQFADWADCSENGARQALRQLVEMGIAEQTETRPATYKRNPSYFRWKRVETLARDNSVGELRTRFDELIDEDQELQEKYGVPTPDAVVTEDISESHEDFHDRWEELTEWQTIRRDITLLKRAIQRAESLNDSGVRSKP